MRHYCISAALSTYSTLIPKKNNEVLLRNLQNRSDDGSYEWFSEDAPDHRAYMRLLQVEARKRGLDPTCVTGLK